MNLRKFDHFLALVETGSFSKAADQVYLSQSALSRSIQSLEDDLGIPLIDRINGKMVPTPQGAIILKKIRRITFDAKELLETIQRINGVEEGEVKLGTGPFPAAMALEPVLKEMIIEHPRLKIHVERANPELLLELLNDNKLDLVVGDSRYVSNTSNIHVIELPPQPVGFVASAKHPLLRPAPQKLSLADLSGFMIGTPTIPPSVVEEIRQQGLKNFPSLICEDMQLLVQLASETDLIAIVPDKMIQRINKPLGIHKLPIEIPFDLSAHPRIMFAKGKTIGPATNKLICTFARQFGLNIDEHPVYSSLTEDQYILR